MLNLAAGYGTHQQAGRQKQKTRQHEQHFGNQADYISDGTAMHGFMHGRRRRRQRIRKRYAGRRHHCPRLHDIHRQPARGLRAQLAARTVCSDRVLGVVVSRLPERNRKHEADVCHLCSAGRGVCWRFVRHRQRPVAAVYQRKRS